MNYHIKSTTIQMNEPWSIPRASLGSISSNTSQKSHSNPASVKIHNSNKSRGHTNRGYLSEGSDLEQDHRQRSRQPSKTLIELQNKFDEYSNTRRHRVLSNDSITVGPKRGSRSSQGSTDSNHSSHSASSGSLLLTAANLERFTHVQKHPSSQNGSTTNDAVHTQYKSNITLSSSKGFDPPKRTESQIPIDTNRYPVKAKDVDAVSVASSTHFTVVNGMGGPQRNSSSGICSRGHQITILIVSMSIFFMIGILGAIYLLEMRAREMPHS